MGKIAKNEILYWIPVLLWVMGIYAAIILIAGLRFMNHMRILVDIVGAATGFMILTFFIINIFFTYYEMRESRLRNLAALPVTINQIGISRILAPILLNCLVLVIYIIIDHGTFYFVYHEALGQAELNAFIRSILGFIIYWLLIVFAFRLFTELYGRILLALALLLNLVIYVLLPIFHWGLAHSIAIILNREVYSGSNGYFIPLGFLLLIWILLYLSLVNRKSYIAL